MDSVQNWLSNLRTSTPLIPLDRVIVLLWNIWKARNNKVFRNEVSNPVAILIRAKKASVEWRIRYKLTQSIHSLHPHSSTTNPKKTYWIA